MDISNFAQSVAPSATLAAGAKARELRAQGINVLDFSLGEPDFTTPDHIIEAAHLAATQGYTHYTPASGLPDLKEAIAEYHKNRHGLNYTAANVCVSSGAKHTLYSAFCALLNPGDEVLVPTPCWTSYTEMLKMTGAVPVTVYAGEEQHFKATADQLRAVCTDKTKMLLFNSPSNPTGATYTKEELESLAELAKEKDLIVISDEIYDRLVFGETQFHSFAALSQDAFDRTLTVNGVSKTFAMTGWRIGWTCGPANVIKAMGSLQSQQTGNPCSVSQRAAFAALTGDQSPVEEMHTAFAERRKFVIKRVNEIPGLTLADPTGAFYAFFGINHYLGKTIRGQKMETSADFCRLALEQIHMNMVQGSAFDAEGYVRLSYATSMEILKIGLETLEKWLSEAQ